MNVRLPRYLSRFLRDDGVGSGFAVSFSDAQGVNLSNYKTIPDKLPFPFYTSVFILPPCVIFFLVVLLSLLLPLNNVSAASSSVMRKCRHIHSSSKTSPDICKHRSTVKNSIISQKKIENSSVTEKSLGFITDISRFQQHYIKFGFNVMVEKGELIMAPRYN